jgi:CBS domain-containing protein
MLEKDERILSSVNFEEFNAPVSTLGLSDVKFIDEKTSVQDTMNILIENGNGCLLIGTSESIIGIVTEKDFLYKVALNYEEIKDKPVSDIMTKSPFVFDGDNTISEVIDLMCSKEFRHLPVKIENSVKVISVNHLISFFLEYFQSDIKVHGTKVDWSKDGVYLQEFVHYDEEDHANDLELSPQIFETPLRKIMFREALHCSINDSIEEVIKSLIKNKKSTALVMNFETELKGIISEKDLLRKVYSKVDIQNNSISEFMTADPHKLLEQDLIAVAINNMSKYKYRSVIVANQGGYPISIVSILDILKYISVKLKEKINLTD